MEYSFKGRRIVVTGAGRGIGRDLCLRLHKYGAQVVAISKTQENLESLRKEIPKLETVCVDLTNWDETRKTVIKITDKPVHGLVNNAAMACLEPFLDATEESFDVSFNVNVKAVMNVSQIIAKGMITHGTGGSIVNISSQASKAALLDHAVYCATKGALDALSRVMALELGKHNIRVNCVNPTVVMTEMGKLGWSDPVKAKSMTDKIPLGRFAEMGEVSNCILFLLSEQASMVNGIVLPIDGGFLAC